MKPEFSRHAAHGLRLVRGGGEGGVEALRTRDAVARVLMEAGADLLLRRISVERAEHIERCVNRILHLFDLAESEPEQLANLQVQLEALELLMQESRGRKRAVFRKEGHRGGVGEK
ncbi:MAG: hypothetical protein FWB81_08765 [Cystobacterineae bacterium]|nr:hypothetical protein [Cystobacterineae bacterium]